MPPLWQRPLRRRRLPLQQKGNHGVSDGPPKTLSSRFQALSHLQPAEPPRRRWNRARKRLPAPAAPAAAERPLFPTNRAEQAVQNRSIGTLAVRAQARYRLASVQCTNSASGCDYSVISSRLHRPPTSCRLRSSSPISPRTPERFCACAHAWMLRPILSSPQASRFPTGISAAPAWTISTMSLLHATTHGQNSSYGVTTGVSGWSCSRPRGPAALWAPAYGG